MIILHILGEFPTAVNCQGHAHVTPDIEDVTNISLSFPHNRFATIQSSWLEPRKVREMTIVGTRRMILYDDLQTLEKIRIFDVRVERPPHYDTFAEFQYSYHYGDSYIPHINQVYMLFRARLLDMDFSAGAETLEARLFTEPDIPWDEIAFLSVRNTLSHYYADRRNGEFKFHLGTIERARPIPSA